MTVYLNYLSSISGASWRSNFINAMEAITAHLISQVKALHNRTRQNAYQCNNPNFIKNLSAKERYVVQRTYTLQK